MKPIIKAYMTVYGVSEDDAWTAYESMSPAQYHEVMRLYNSGYTAKQPAEAPTTAPAEETTETETETEEKEEEETMFNNYVEAVTEDAAQYICDNYTAEEIAEAMADRDEFAERLNDEMWVADEVTGNASGSYTFDRLKAREYVLADTDTVREALREFGTEADTIAEKFLYGEWEYFDVTARCYVLGQAIDMALNIIEADSDDSE